MSWKILMFLSVPGCVVEEPAIPSTSTDSSTTADTLRFNSGCSFPGAQSAEIRGVSAYLFTHQIYLWIRGVFDKRQN